MWEISENLVQVAFWRSPVAVPKLVTAGCSLPVGMGLLCSPAGSLSCVSSLGLFPAPHLSPVLCCSWGSLTYAILWLVQDIQYFTKTLSSGKQRFTVPRAACVCSFLPQPQTWCLLTPALEMNHCHCIPAGCSFHFSWHIKCGRWVFFLILFYYTEYCHFKRHIQQQQMFLFILFLLCDNCSWLRVFSPSPHTSCESSPGDATRRLSSLSLAKNELKTNKQTKQREHWVKNDLNSKYKK